jgi:hypothetical protein
MLDSKQLNRAQYEAQQCLAECVHKGAPLLVARGAIIQVAREFGLPEPEDKLAWATGGSVSDSEISTWLLPLGD